MMSNSLLSGITTRLLDLSDTPALDASVLLAHITGKPRTWIMAHPELTLTQEQQSILEDSLVRLESGESFPYVLGRWEFFGLDFVVTPDVLIPRPETELLVEKAVSWLNVHPGRRSVADIGTGAGTIAVSLATQIKNAMILATDISTEAVRIAKLNAKNHNVLKQIDFIECDLFPRDTSPHSLDLVCANLPYIPTSTLKGLPVYRHEPTLALDGGVDGFELIRKLMSLAPKIIAPGALLLFEIEASLGQEALNLSRQMFPNANIQLHLDLSGCDRLLEIQV